MFIYTRLDENDEENQVVGGVMWSDEAITFSAAHEKGGNRNEIHLQNLSNLRKMHTISEFLAVEGEKFRGWVECGRVQDIWNDMNSDWKTILGNLELQGKLIGIELWKSGIFQQQEAALVKHCQERILKIEAAAREPTLDDDPGEPPWG
jgi:hypothetical protein